MANLQLFFEKHADSGRKVPIFALFRPLSALFATLLGSEQVIKSQLNGNLVAVSTTHHTKCSD